MNYHGSKKASSRTPFSKCVKHRQIFGNQSLGGPMGYTNDEESPKKFLMGGWSVFYMSFFSKKKHK